MVKIQRRREKKRAHHTKNKRLGLPFQVISLESIMSQKEIVHNVLSLRFTITFVLFVVLIQLSVFVLTSDYETALRSHTASKASHRERLSALKGLESLDQQVDELLYEQGVYGSRAPQPLRIFVRGLEDHLPSQVHTSLWMSRRINEEFFRNPLFLFFTAPDYSYIINIVVSLLSLLFVFDAICGEKERGTLKLVLANSVPRDLVLLGKWIGGYISLAFPFLVALLGGLTYVRLTGAIQLEGETLERLLWIIVVSLLYISLFFTLGMLISVLTHKASTALIIALFVWVCWILVIPNLSPVIAKMAVPVPTLQKLSAQKAAVDRETEIRQDRFLRKFYVMGKKREDMLKKIEQEGERRKRRLDNFYQDKLQGQLGFSKNLSRISPSASFTYAVTDLAGTGLGLFEGFKHGYRRFRDEFREYGLGIDERRDADKLPEKWFQLEEVPTLTVLPLHLDDAVNSVLTDLLLLLVFNVLFFMGSYLFFLRYDVT